MASLAFELREAFYDVLRSIDFKIDTTAILTGAGQPPGIYDRVPQERAGGGSLFPCVVIGVRVATESNTDDTLGQSVITRIHTHSRSGSSKEVEYMQDAIYEALRDVTFVLTDWDMLMIDREQSDITEIAEGRFQGTCEYRTLLTEQ